MYIYIWLFIYIYIRYICFLCKSVCMPQLPLANWPICFFYENLIYFFVVFFFKVHSNEQAGWWRHGGCFGGRETLTPDCPIWVPIGRFLHPWETAPPGAVETAKFLCRLWLGAILRGWTDWCGEVVGRWTWWNFWCWDFKMTCSYFESFPELFSTLQWTQVIDQPANPLGACQECLGLTHQSSTVEQKDEIQ